MKRILSLCLLAIGMIAGAQTNQVITKKLQLNTVPNGLSTDKVLVRGADKIVKEVSQASLMGVQEAPIDGNSYLRTNATWTVFSGGNTPLQNVLNSGNTALNTSISLENGGNYQNPTSWSFTRLLSSGGIILQSLGSTSPTNINNDITLINNVGSTYISPDGGALLKLRNGGASGYAPTPTSWGLRGEIRIVGGYVYFCTDTNVSNSTATWVRSPIQTTW
jgi:hypothetical protein